MKLIEESEINVQQTKK